MMRVAGIEAVGYTTTRWNLGSVATHLHSSQRRCHAVLTIAERKAVDSNQRGCNQARRHRRRVADQNAVDRLRLMSYPSNALDGVRAVSADAGWMPSCSTGISALKPIIHAPSFARVERSNRSFLRLHSRASSDQTDHSCAFIRACCLSEPSDNERPSGRIDRSIRSFAFDRCKCVDSCALNRALLCI
jgi:hypothetical protein